MSEIKVEFAVQMHGTQCASKVRDALKGLGEVQINTEEGRVIVQTREPWSTLLDRIEKTGRKAVLSGFGGQSAVAIINSGGTYSERSPVQGVVRFTTIREAEPGVVVDGVVDGLAPGLHGLHVHESGDVSNGCASLGDHYNPRGSPHGAPENDATKRHAGDLGNIRADTAGRATFRFVDPMLDVGEIIGRSVVVTESPDDLGRSGTVQSRVDGNAGRRLACGIIARSAGILQNFKKICACDGVTIWDERIKPPETKSPNGNHTQKL